MAPTLYSAISGKKPCPVTPAAGMGWLQRWAQTAPSWHQHGGKTVTSALQTAGHGFSPGAVFTVDWWVMEKRGRGESAHSVQQAYKSSYTVLEATDTSVKLDPKLAAGGGQARAAMMLPRLNAYMTIAFTDEGDGKAHVQVERGGEVDLEDQRKKTLAIAVRGPCSARTQEPSAPSLSAPEHRSPRGVADLLLDHLPAVCALHLVHPALQSAHGPEDRQGLAGRSRRHQRGAAGGAAGCRPAGRRGVIGCADGGRCRHAARAAAAAGGQQDLGGADQGAERPADAGCAHRGGVRCRQGAAAPAPTHDLRHVYTFKHVKADTL